MSSTRGKFGLVFITLLFALYGWLGFRDFNIDRGIDRHGATATAQVRSLHHTKSSDWLQVEYRTESGQLWRSSVPVDQDFPMHSTTQVQVRYDTTHPGHARSLTNGESHLSTVIIQVVVFGLGLVAMLVALLVASFRRERARNLINAGLSTDGYEHRKTRDIDSFIGHQATKERPTLRRVLTVGFGAIWVAAVVVTLVANFTGTFDTKNPKLSVSGYKPQLNADGAPNFIPVSDKTPLPDPSAKLPPALTYKPSPNDPVVTPKQAEDIVRATWDLRAHAMSTIDEHELATFESDIAYKTDSSQCRCKSGDNNLMGDIVQLDVSVERKTTYPAQFFAQVSTTASNKPWLSLLVFTRANEDAHWVLSFVGGAQTDTQSSVMRQPTDTQGYATSQLMKGEIEPRDAFIALSKEWAQTRNTGKVPTDSIFMPGVWTNQREKDLAQYHQGVRNINGMIGYYAYMVDPADPVYVFPQGLGYKIACSAIRVQRTWAGSNALNGPYQDADKKHWPESIPPGAHQAIIQTDLSVPCIEIPRAGISLKPNVLGAYEDTYISDYR